MKMGYREEKPLECILIPHLLRHLWLISILQLHLSSMLVLVTSTGFKGQKHQQESNSQYDARMADETYKAGLASMAAGKLDDAVHPLNNALSKCPPDKISAFAKLQSLISLTSQQLQKSSN